jgi:hypothetical protein
MCWIDESTHNLSNVTTLSHALTCTLHCPVARTVANCAFSPDARQRAGASALQLRLAWVGIFSWGNTGSVFALTRAALAQSGASVQAREEQTHMRQHRELRFVPQQRQYFHTGLHQFPIYGKSGYDQKERDSGCPWLPLGAHRDIPSGQFFNHRICKPNDGLVREGACTTL